MFTEDQVEVLEEAFRARKRYTTREERVSLAADLRLSERQVMTWFQNRRTKWRKQQSNLKSDVSEKEEEEEEEEKSVDEC